MDIKGTVLVVLFGVLLSCVDGARVRRGYWDLALDPKISNGNPSLSGSLGYKNGGFSTGLEYQGRKGYHKFGGSIGYEKNNFGVMGSGFRDTNGNWGVGASLRWRFKRALPPKKGVFVLRVEADPCQFMLYDRDSDGIVIAEEVREIFPDENLANDLFAALDSDGDAAITPDEFEAAKIREIAGCLPPDVED